MCFITCEFESRYLHQVKLRIKSSWLFIFEKFERAVSPGPKRHTVQQMISANRNCSYRAIALGKSVAADLLRFADKSAHQVRSCTSVCLTTCEFNSRYLHQVKLRMKNSWLFIFVKFERAVPPGPKRHTVQQMISTNRNCSYRAIALGKSVAADLLRFADKSAHQVRSCTSVCFITCEFESRYL